MTEGDLVCWVGLWPQCDHEGRAQAWAVYGPAMWRVVACWVLAIAVAGCGDGDGVDQPGVSAQFGECQVTDHEIGVGTTIEFEVPVTNGSGEQDFELWVDVYFRDEFYAGWGTVQSDVPAGLSFVVTEEIDFEEEVDGSLSDWSCEVVPW